MSTRHETQMRTRAALLRAGEEELLEKGIHNASLRSIAAKAGYSLGAFYSNFPSRDAFLLEIFDAIHERLFASLDGVIDLAVTHGMDGGVHDIAMWIRQARRNALSDLLLEFSIYAAHDAKFRTLFTPYLESWRKRIELSLTRLFNGFGLVPRLPVGIMAAGFSALWQGLTLESSSLADDADKSLVIWLTLLLNDSKSGVQP